MASKKRKKPKKGPRPPASRPAPRAEAPVPRKSWIVPGLLAAAVLAAAILIVVLVIVLRDPGADPSSLPKVKLGGEALPVQIVTRHAARVKHVPEQMNPYERPLAGYFSRFSSPVGVLFPYPDDQFRTVHLDPDPRGGSLTLLFLKTGGEIDSIHRITRAGYLARSEGVVRFALFIPPGCKSPIRMDLKIELPQEAFEPAEPEFVPITDPPPAEIRIGGATLEVEIAHTGPRRARGLMYRPYIPDGKGMIFLFPEARKQTFWMKNTRTSLDIAYIDENFTLRNVVTMKAHDLNRAGVYASDGPVNIVLETRDGWFKAFGVGKGAKLELPERVKELLANAEP